MKIIKQGEKPPRFPWMGQYTCAYCDSTIELTEDDESLVYRWEDDQREGMFVTIRCPVCEKRSLHKIETSTGPYGEQWDR